MELLLSRDQKNGMLGMGAIKFVLEARARLTDDEAVAVKKYKMGNSIVYEKPNDGFNPRIELDKFLFEGVDDSGDDVGATFCRACDLWLTAARRSERQRPTSPAGPQPCSQPTATVRVRRRPRPPPAEAAIHGDFCSYAIKAEKRPPPAAGSHDP